MAVLARDNFSRADANPLNGPWIVQTDVNAVPLQIVSQLVESTVVDVNKGASAVRTESWPNDQYSEIQFITLAANTQQAGPLVRALIGITEYRIICKGPFGSSAAYLIDRYVNGVNTPIRAFTTFTLNANDRVKLQVTGQGVNTLLSMFINGVFFTSIIDSTAGQIPSGVPGINVYNSGVGPLTSLQVDNWEGGDTSGDFFVGGQDWEMSGGGSN